MYAMAGCFFASASQDDFAGCLGRIIFLCAFIPYICLPHAFSQNMFIGMFRSEGFACEKERAGSLWVSWPDDLATRPLLNALAGWFCSTSVCVFCLSLSFMHSLRFDLQLFWVYAGLVYFLSLTLGKWKLPFCLSRLFLSPAMCLKVFLLWLLGG